MTKQPAAPRLAAALETQISLCEAASLAAGTEEPLEGFAFSGEKSGEALDDKMEIFGCRFAGCTFSRASLAGAYLRDCVFDQCDLSLLRAPDATFSRCRFTGCKLTGANLSGTVLRDCVFVTCPMDALSLAEAHLQATLFDGSCLRGAAITELHARSTFAFSHCDLREADFTHTALAGQDLTGCELSGAFFTGPELRGARVTALQASELARLLGVVVV